MTKLPKDAKKLGRHAKPYGHGPPVPSAWPPICPCSSPPKFELAVHLKTAKAPAFTVPPTLLVQANVLID